MGCNSEANGNEMRGPTSKPFAKVFACAGVVFVAVSLVTLAKIGPLGEGIDIGFAVGSLFALLTIPAVATGYFARRSSEVWSISRIFTTYVVALAIVVVLLLPLLIYLQ